MRIPKVVLTGLLAVLGACGDIGAPGTAPETGGPSFSGSAGGTDTFLASAFTVGPNYEILRASEPTKLCGSRNVTYDDGRSIRVVGIKTFCQSGLSGQTALPYNGGHTDIYINGYAAQLAVVPGDFSEKAQILDAPNGASITLDANPYCKFLHHDIRYDDGRLVRVFSDPYVVQAGNLSSVKTWYQECN